MTFFVFGTVDSVSLCHGRLPQRAWLGHGLRRQGIGGQRTATAPHAGMAGMDATMSATCPTYIVLHTRTLQHLLTPLWIFATCVGDAIASVGAVGVTRRDNPQRSGRR